MSDNNDLRGKIDQAKRRLPLPELMAQVGLGDCAKKTAHCPFHDDEHKSFSVFQGKDGWWHYNCFAGCGDGDEIMFLRKLKGLSMTDAMSLYLEMAGFPPGHPPKSHKYPKSHESRKFLESPECPESPVSNGQGSDIRGFVARRACRQHGTADKALFQLARDFRTVEKRIGEKAGIAELRPFLDEWYEVSQPFLDPKKNRNDYLGKLLAAMEKVRVPTGEGDRLNKALENVSKLSDADLPVIPAYADAPENWRRLAALHRELSRLCVGNTYFLSYRDAAKACDELTHQTAHTFTLALVRLGVIEIVRKGKAGLNSRKAAQFRYLLPETETSGEEDSGFDL
jgi:hypothetical protein